MRVWQLDNEWGVDRLEMVERSSPTPGPGQIVVKLLAASLNSRDLRVIQGKLVTLKGPGTARLPLIPLSDGAGVVVSVGKSVTRVKVGDRVCPMFFQTWRDGGFKDDYRDQALGATVPGVLQDEMLLSEEAVARFPDHLTYRQAATLPCASLTAWHALVCEGRLAAGETVLIQGTGGVSLFALQFAKMLNAQTIVLSSSDDRLERARTLGADHVINYRATPEWAPAVLNATQGAGVDHVVEVCGRDTLEQSVKASASGGRVYIIGLLSGIAKQIAPLDILLKNLKVIGVSVGSRVHFETMCAAIREHELKPVIDRAFSFEDVPKALRFMESAEYFGKICIDYDLDSTEA